MVGGARLRRVSYPPGYLADHWCTKGHIIYVISGKLITELEDGRVSETPAGGFYVVGDNMNPHRSRAEEATELVIIDSA